MKDLPSAILVNRGDRHPSLIVRIDTVTGKTVGVEYITRQPPVDSGVSIESALDRLMRDVLGNPWTPEADKDEESSL